MLVEKYYYHLCLWTEAVEFLRNRMLESFDSVLDFYSQSATYGNSNKTSFLEIETELGFPLPEIYKNYLSYGNFSNLNFVIYDSGHVSIPYSLKRDSKYYDMVQDYVERGFYEEYKEYKLYPFADDRIGGGGEFCFRSLNGSEYDIIWFDYDWWEPSVAIFSSFEDVLKYNMRKIRMYISQDSIGLYKKLFGVNLENDLFDEAY